MDISCFRTWAEIDLDALAHNFNTVRRILPQGTKIAAVIKANAYGHGAIRIAKALSQKADYFAVAMPEEGYELRHAGISDPILVLGHAPEGQWESMVKQDLTATICDTAEACHLSEIACRQGKKALVHLAIDTGMNRIGWIPGEDSLEQILSVSRLPGLSIEGAFSHFAKSDTPCDLSYAKQQAELFMRFTNRIIQAGIPLPIRHICNSAAVFSLSVPLDMVRLGIALYGLCPSNELPIPQSHGIRPVMHLRSRITQIKTLPKGSPVSYSCTYITEKETKVATVCAGYADGVPRLLSNRGYLLVNGKKAPILGRVCMDQLMVDVTDIPNVKKGDAVTIFGVDNDSYLSADELASLCDTIGYEVITGIDRRVPRVAQKEGNVVSIDSSLPFC
ncbi:MAG: alanine racemase [Ruminococcaceae bacterium]|nr:alanine racemase [Oscillospiraceae bacterium]